MISSQDWQYCRISLASPEQVRNWAERKLPNGETVGCVTEPHTVDYQTHKPEKDGLFCERIFGPTKSYVCACGKYHDTTTTIHEEVATFCEECGVEITEARVRRHRMGYINLECCVTHPWYLKQRPNYIGRLLNQPSKYINSLVYYDACLTRRMVNRPTLLLFAGEKPPYSKQQREPSFDMPLELFSFDHGWKKALENLISGRWFRILQDREIVTGGDAVHKLLSNMNLETAIENSCQKCDFLVKERKEKYIRHFSTDYINESIEDRLETRIAEHSLYTLWRRLRLLQKMVYAQVKPEWMVLSCLAVLPPMLRPMVALKEGQFITSDLNNLYQIVIYRNNRLAWVTQNSSPDLVLNMQKRLLQQGVDALLSNGAGALPLTDKHGRAYKSFSDIIKGKKGRFRENLLGKRVDYSGRSVIVVGPSLSLNQCGLPEEMAVELFLPFLIRRLIVTGIAKNLRVAKNLIKNKAVPVWSALHSIVQENLVILNRAPTLHRLGMQAFQPVLVKGRAIHLHPLVCTGFNADFDGDQMAVHVPLSLEAQTEVRMLMLPFLNLLSPATGEAVTVPSQDMLLGLYVLTLEHDFVRSARPHNYKNRFSQAMPKLPTFLKYSDVLTAYNQQLVSCHSRIWLRSIGNAWIVQALSRQVPIEIQYEANVNGTQLFIFRHSQIRQNRQKQNISYYIRTTVGRVLFNQQIEQAMITCNLYA